ncbi:MAG: glycosyltransferase family 1 protein [Chryseobacterium sp.]|nr:MAG: glycosyltransferase family 1 protein [Chryseobacterium sp.]
MLHIGVDIRDLRIAKTGARTYLEELVREFKLLEDDQVCFHFFDTSFPVYTGKNKFLKLIEHIRFITWKQLILPTKAWSKKCDILFCSDFFVPYIHLGYKTIPVLHDAFFFEYPEHYNKVWLFLFKHLGISSARRAYQIITPTAYTRETIAHLSGIAKEKIIAIAEGPKTLIKTSESTHPVTNPLFQQRYLLHVGTMEIRKNIVSLLKAFLLLLQDDPQLKLVLIGQFSPKTDMDDKVAIQEFIEVNNLNTEVIFPGYVPDELLSTYYSKALIYVFPSINEGFGIPILEAFDHQVPVVIANNSCLPEVGGNAVLSFDPYDVQDIYSKISSLLNDPDKRANLVRKGTQRLADFSWKITATELLKIFKKSKLEKKK